MKKEKSTARTKRGIAKLSFCLALSLVMAISYFGIVPAFAQGSDDAVQKTNVATDFSGVDQSGEQGSDSGTSNSASDGSEDQASDPETNDNAVDESNDQAPVLRLMQTQPKSLTESFQLQTPILAPAPCQQSLKKRDHPKWLLVPEVATGHGEVMVGAGGVGMATG